MDYKEKIKDKIRIANPWDETVCEMCCDYGFNGENKMSCCADGELIEGKQKCPTNELAVTSLTDQVLNIGLDCEKCHGDGHFYYVEGGHKAECDKCHGTGKAGLSLGEVWELYQQGKLVEKENK
ncbi:hypothetical protein LCGC14_1442630 [marine sediment metagenome]|uniref:Uncharacterized protein n=1 Tax=marine sediment metagenome TaxID=412755 RepID=A0A0F9JK55_9ZZZZ